MDAGPVLAQAAVLLMCVMRAGGLAMTAPVLSARGVPAPLKMALAAALALAAFAGLPPEAQEAGHRNASWLIQGALRETLYGALAGLAGRLGMEVASSAGAAAGGSMGFSMGAMVNPLSGAESTLVADLLSLTALGFGLALGLHRDMALWLMRSLHDHPPGTVLPLNEALLAAMDMALQSISLGLRLAFPVVVAVTLGQIVWGIASRTAAQLNLSSMGFSVTILCGGAVLYVVAPTMALVAAQTAASAFRQ